MDRVLVTGGAGFIGAALVRTLVGRGVEVHAVVHPRTDISRLADVERCITVHRVDLTDYDELVEAVRTASPAVVFHTAARGGHPATPQDVLSAWNDTVVGTAVLLESLRHVDLGRFVHLGSSLEYAPSALPLREDDPLEPRTTRGATKLAAAIAVRQHAQATGLHAVLLRPFSVYGPGEPAGRLVPTLMESLQTGAPFRTTTTVARRDFVYVQDVVEACLRAATSVAALPGTVVNVGTGVEATTNEVVALAQEVTGRALVVHPGGFPARPSDAEHWVADVSRAHSVLGWKPSVDLAEGLRRTFAGYAASSRP